MALTAGVKNVALKQSKGANGSGSQNQVPVEVSESALL